MKIVYLSNGTPFDKRTFSGVSYSTFQELRRRYGEVHVVDTPRFDRLIVKAGRLRRYGILPPRSSLVAWAYARMLIPKLEAINPDVVICVHAAQKIVSFVNRWPCMLAADITVGPLLDYNPVYKNISARGRRLADEQERAIVESAASIVLSSHWAAEEGAKHYGVPVSRFVVAPFGPNFEEIPEVADPAVGGPLKLLFVAFVWEPKGGDIALAAFKQIQLRAPDTEFHVVGCQPQSALETPGVIVHGRLNKNDPQQAEKLKSLFRSSSFFLMPTRYEAYGIVYAEACAFGLPPVAGKTGGVGTIIRDGENGLLLPYDAPPEAYADAILAVWQNPERYQTMRRAARAAFETRLNWRAWGDTVDAELRRIARSPSGPASVESHGTPAPQPIG